ncbi:MAG: hypothetical protein L0H39_11310 [Brachybacterium sp.]|nr:hypothetical protein [Brachybacterium sp.]MDN6301422.1 hypothetical protein [Brachybacterium sp.]
MNELDEMMEAPEAVVEMTIGAAIGHSLLLVLGLFLCLVAGVVVERGTGDLVGVLLLAVGGMALLIQAENRFFRAVSATNASGHWVAIIIFVTLAVAVGVLTWRLSVPAALWSAGPALLAVPIARALDRASEALSGIPLGWIPAIGIVLVIVGLVSGKIKL